MNTKEKILSRALEMFNERGIEYVGLRELAALLDMRVSNITYYFPTKDHLVYEISLALTALDWKVIVKDEELTITKFMNMLHQVFQNHVKYRCLFLSYVHLMEQNKMIVGHYQKSQSERNVVVESNFKTLIKSGYIKIKDNKDIEFLMSNITLIIRFWISEAAISYRHLSIEKQIRHYLTMIARLLLQYSTAKSKKEIELFLKGV